MLLSEGGYQTNKDDFNEINNEIINAGSFQIPNGYKINNNNNGKNDSDKLSRNVCWILFLIGFAYGGMLLASLAASSILSLFSMDDGLYLILTEVFTYVFLFCSLGFVAFKSKNFFIKNLKDGKNYLFGLVFGALTLCAEIVVSSLIASFYQAEVNSNQSIVNELTKNYPTLMIITTVIIGPFCEELTYRVGLYELLRKKNEVFGFIVSGLVFAFVHIGFTDTTFLAEITAFPVYLTIAYLFNLAYKKYGLAGSVTAHAITNLVSMLAILLVWKRKNF